MGFFDYFTKQASDVGPLPEGEKSGFFGTSWDDPRTQANMALFAGLLSGGGNKGFAGALGQGVENMSGAMHRYREQRFDQQRQNLAKEQMEWERARQEKIDAQPDPKQMERYRINQLLARAPTTIGGHHAVQGGNMGEVDVNQEPLPYADVQMNRANAVMGEYPDLGMKFAEEARKASEQPKTAQTELQKLFALRDATPPGPDREDIQNQIYAATNQPWKIKGWMEAQKQRAMAGTEAGAAAALDKDLAKNMKVAVEETEKANAAAAAFDHINGVANKISALEKSPALNSAIGLTGSITGMNPYGETASIHRTIEELKSANFVQGIREAKLAGFSGSQTEREGMKLETQISNLDPRDKNFRSKLQQIKEQYLRFVSSARAQYGASLTAVQGMQSVMPEGVQAPMPRELPSTPMELIPKGTSINGFNAQQSDNAAANREKLLRDFEAMKQRLNGGQ